MFAMIPSLIFTLYVLPDVLTMACIGRGIVILISDINIIARVSIGAVVQALLVNRLTF